MTAKLLVEQLKSKFDEKAILLTVRPVSVEGKRTSKQFYKFVPPKEWAPFRLHCDVNLLLVPRLFTPLVHEVEAMSTPLLWPQPTASYKTTTDDLSCYVRANSAFKLRCGWTDCEYELIAYQFIPGNTEIRDRTEETGLENSTDVYPRAQQDEDLFSSCFNGTILATTTEDSGRAKDTTKSRETGIISGRMLVW